MEEIEWWEFASAEEMAEQVVGDIAFVIESAIAAHGGARLGLPGSLQPEPIFERLAVSRAIDWSKVTLVPTDDRLVPADHDFSNYGRLVRFFGGTGATIVPLVDDSALGDYREAGRIADRRLGEMQWPLDLVWLGVGEDGHTASIFPGPDYDRTIAGPRERRAVGVRPDPMPEAVPFERVTMTAPALSSARAAMLVLRGDKRREMVERAIGQGPLSDLPIGRLLAEFDTAIDIFWAP